MINNPSVAVLLAAHNGIKWIKEQVDTIFQQKDVDVDIYISVDVSSDGTYEWCKELDEKNIEWLEDINRNVYYQTELLSTELDAQTVTLDTISSTLIRLENLTAELKTVQEQQLVESKKTANNTKESRITMP